MKLKKILLILIIILGLSACTNLDNVNYDDILNNFSMQSKHTNTYRNGYKYYIPKGLILSDAGNNYAIISSLKTNYYAYFDLVSYNGKKEIAHEINKNAFYSKNINFEGKVGYVEINLRENNQYLIEIMYNYAKIEVMVDESEIKVALVNAINILNSVKYDDKIIEKLLENDDLTFSEEIFNMFEKEKKNSNILDYVEGEIETNEEEIKDTDFLN